MSCQSKCLLLLSRARLTNEDFAKKVLYQRKRQHVLAFATMLKTLPTRHAADARRAASRTRRRPSAAGDTAAGFDFGGAARMTTELAPVLGGAPAPCGRRA